MSKLAELDTMTYQDLREYDGRDWEVEWEGSDEDGRAHADMAERLKHYEEMHGHGPSRQQERELRYEVWRPHLRDYIRRVLRVPPEGQ